MKSDKQPADDVFSYDELPYGGNTHASTHPRRIGAIARLFGIEPVDLQHARVLEIGCGLGDDLLPLAAAYPEADFIGIDLGRRHVDVANGLARERGLANVNFRQMDITAMDPNLGRFDYVIAHGVFSWVPPPVAQALLRICESLLTDRGLVYISYNTYPDWEQMGKVRDAMRAHVAGLPSPLAQVEATRRFVAKEVLAKRPDTSKNQSYDTAIRRVAARVEHASDSYVFHEFLCEHNHPIWFADFVANASDHGLRYVGDTDRTAMWGDGDGATSNRIEREQALDRALGRGFRSSVLCKNPLEPTSEALPESLLNTCLSTQMLDRGEGQFGTSDAVQVTVTGTGIVKALRDITKAQGRPIPFASEWLQDNESQSVCDDLLNLIKVGLIDVGEPGGPGATQIEERPVAFEIARALAAEGRDLVVGLGHRATTLDSIGQFILPRLDGTRDRNALARQVLAAMRRGELPALAPGTKKADAQKQVLTDIESWLERTLASELLVSSFKHN